MFDDEDVYTEIIKFADTQKGNQFLAGCVPATNVLGLFSLTVFLRLLSRLNLRCFNAKRVEFMENMNKYHHKTEESMSDTNLLKLF